MANFSIASSLQSLERLFIAPWKIAATPDTTDVKRFFTPLDQAVAEIERRRQDPALMQAVTDFLNNDIPEHFRGDQPIFYLSRHVATPNYEALRFIELARPYKLPLVIGQDRRGKFVSNNELKLPLGKMPVTKGISHNQDEIIENFTIIDFVAAQGKPMEQVVTKFGTDLVTYHNRLFREIYSNTVQISDETDWVDRNFRNDIKKQYEHMLALMCAHGIMFESYPTTERDFVKEVLAPAFDAVTQRFGCTPLIVEHIPEELEITRNWNAYPSVLYSFIKRDIAARS